MQASEEATFIDNDLKSSKSLSSFVVAAVELGYFALIVIELLLLDNIVTLAWGFFTNRREKTF